MITGKRIYRELGELCKQKARVCLLLNDKHKDTTVDCMMCVILQELGSEEIYAILDDKSVHSDCIDVGDRTFIYLDDILGYELR